MNDTLQIYNQIEVIKATIGFNSINNDKSEQWIQRQNLQDLYHQVILGDIDFTIDKKLEQDLWNFVFKNQISHFQAQIKDKKNAKRPEAEANLFFFLEAARGFYTKLLQDIVLTYDLELPFCKNFNFLSNNCFNYLIGNNQCDETLGGAGGENREKAKEKQLMYICQHILTHLGDIARYATMFDQAKSYYLHAIKLVPYLGQPYNQIGILFDTLRTNQLSTVFYYIRSIAVRYTFPLAATNLEKFFHKLIEIPLSRYPSDMTKLTHKDYIQLFLQINALIYTGVLSNKIQTYLDLFKTIINSNSSVSSTTSAATTFSFEKFDSVYLCQMMSILFFMLIRFQTPSSNFQFTLSLTLLVYLIEQCLKISQRCQQKATANNNDINFILPGFYLAFSFLEQFDSNTNADDEALFKSNIFKQQNSTLWNDIAKLLNSFQIKRNQLTPDENCDTNETIYYSNYKDYPLNEERNLESFMPLKDCLKQFNFKKYFNNKNLLIESDELMLRKIRIVSCFERIIKRNKNFEYLKTSDSKNGTIEFSSGAIDVVLSTNETTPKQAEVVPTVNYLTVPPMDVNIRKKRQNVAISSFIAQAPAPPAPPPSVIQTNSNNNKIPHTMSNIFNSQQSNFNEQSNYQQKMQPQQNFMNKNQFVRNPMTHDLNNLLHNNNQQQQQPFPSFNPHFNQQTFNTNFNQMNKPSMQQQQQHQDVFYNQMPQFQQQQQQQRTTFPTFLPDTTKMSPYQNNNKFPQQQQQQVDNQQFQQHNKQTHQLQQQPRNFQINSTPFNQQAYQNQIYQQQQQQQKPLIDSFPSFFESSKTGSYNSNANQQHLQASNSLIDNNSSVYSKISNIWSNGSYGSSNTNLIKNEPLLHSTSSYNHQANSSRGQNSDFGGLNLDFNSSNYLSSNMLWSLNGAQETSTNNNELLNSSTSLMKSTQLKSFNNNSNNVQNGNDSGGSSMLTNILPQIWSFPRPPGITDNNNNEPS